MSDIALTYTVKWYDHVKGVGYLQMKGFPDILVTAGACKEHVLVEGATVAAAVRMTSKGLRATRIFSVSTATQSFEGDGPILAAMPLKWFNASKGFGFIEMFMDTNGDICEPYDAFLHASVVNACGLNAMDLQMSPGTLYDVRIADQQDGRVRVTAIREHVEVVEVTDPYCAGCEVTDCSGCDVVENR